MTVMDFRLNERQELFRRTARDFLEAECPTSVVREVEESGLGYSPDLWRRVAGLGWLGLGIPEEYSGAGDNMDVHLALFEELGRTLFPGPVLVSSVVAAQVLLAGGNFELRQRTVPAIATGTVIATVAGDRDARYPSFTAETVRDGCRLNGTALFVPFANVADSVICLAQDAGIQDEMENDSVFWLELDSPGITKTRMDSVANYPQYVLELRDVVVAHDALLGPRGGAAGLMDEVLGRAAVLQCAETVGRAEKVLEMVVDYGRNRVQFGRPIGSFQAVQHRCADLKVAVDGSRLLTYQAAWKLGRGEDCAAEIAMARAHAGAASREATIVGHSIFAGISFTLEHDMQLYSARAKLAEADLGDTTRHLERLAATMGLQGS